MTHINNERWPAMTTTAARMRRAMRKRILVSTSTMSWSRSSLPATWRKISLRPQRDSLIWLSMILYVKTKHQKLREISPHLNQTYKDSYKWSQNSWRAVWVQRTTIRPSVRASTSPTVNLQPLMLPLISRHLHKWAIMVEMLWNQKGCF